MSQKSDQIFAWIGTEAFRRFSSVWLAEAEQDIRTHCKRNHHLIELALYKGAILRGKLATAFVLMHVIGIPTVMYISSHTQTPPETQRCLIKK